MRGRFALTMTAPILALIVACGGDDDAQPRATPGDEDSVDLESSSSSFGSGGSLIGVAGGGDLANAPNASTSLPGITVIGYGDAAAKPDEVLIRLTIGQGEFGVISGSDTPRLELIDEAEMQPVIEALKRQRADESQISVSTAINSPYGFGGGAAQVSFRWSKPSDLKSIFDVAEDTVRQETDHGLQNVEVLFTVKDCEPLEQQASSAALEDAQRRAEHLAQLAGLQLGAITSISEVASNSVYGGPSGCAALEELPSFEFPSSSGNNSASEVEVDVSLQVTFALQES
jgi:uncharacterized protein YggE